MARDQRRLAAIVSADVVGYSRLMGRDDSGTLASLKAHRRELIDPKIAEHGGRIVKTMGDGLLLEFPSVVDAVRCAVDVQRGMADRNIAVPADQRIEFRIGINLGDIIIDGEDIFCDGVNVAARIQALAEPGQICVSKAVRDQVLGILSFGFEELGAQQIKNIARPVEVYRAQLGNEAQRTPGTARSPLPRIERSLGGSQQLTHAVKRRWIGSGVVALGIVGIAIWILPQFWRTERTLTAPPLSVAILPFMVPAGNASDEQFADALTRDLTLGLGRSRRLQVISSSTTSSYKGRPIDAPSVGRELNVRYLIEGGVRRVDQRIAVYAQLIDAARAIQLWSDRVEIQDERIALDQAKLVARLTRRLDGALWNADTARADKPLSAGAGTIDFVLAARHASQREAGDPLKGSLEARKLYDQALWLDPNSGAALVGKAGTLAYEVYFNPQLDHDRVVRELDELSFRAVSIDDQDPDAWAVRSVALGLQWRWDAALEANATAQNLDPTRDWLLTQRAELMVFMGQPQAALTLVEQALALDPFGVVAISWPLDIRCRAHMALGQYDESIAACEKSVGEYDWWMPHLYLLAAYTQKGRTAKAEAEKAKLLQQRPSISIADFKALRLSNEPAFLEENETHLFAGLRKGGIPED